METLWSFQTKNFRVTWSIEPDHDCDISFDETSETRDKLASGEWQCFSSKVAVFYDGNEIGADWLGGSIYANPADFRDHIGMNSKGHGSYFSDMVRAACREARAHMLKTRPYIRVAA